MFDRHAKLALIVASLLLVVCGIGFRGAVNALNIYLQKEPVPLRDSLANIARTLGEWRAQGNDAVLDKATLEELGTDKYLDRQYLLMDGDRPIVVAVHVAYYTGLIDAVPHVPDRCFVAGGWTIIGGVRNETWPIDHVDWTDDPEHNNRYGTPYRFDTFRHWVTGQPITVRMPSLEPGKDFELRTSELQHGRHADQRLFAGYCFIANGCFTPSPEGVKAFAFDQRDRYSYYCKVQFVMGAQRDLNRQRFLELSADLMDNLLPELMRCLPDWAEVNAPQSDTRQTANL
jgi:hypothetical protein